MHRPYLILAAFLAFAGTSRAAADPPQLAAEMADRIGRAAPDRKVVIVDDLTLKLIGGPQGESQVNLDRVAAFCAANPPEECEQSKARFVTGIAEMAAGEPKITRENLRVIVRSADYAAAMQEALGKEKKLISQPIGDGLVAVLAADFPNTTALVPNEELQALQLTEEDAFELGRRQVLEALPGIPTLAQLESDIQAIEGHDYDASLLLAEGWKSLAEAAKGLLFVTVADADMVVIGLADDETASRMRETAREHFRTAERGVSPEVYRWSDGVWKAVR